MGRASAPGAGATAQSSQGAAAGANVPPLTLTTRTSIGAGAQPQAARPISAAATHIPGASMYGASVALKPVAVLGPSDFLGEDALLNSGTHTVSAVAETACRVAWLRPADVAVLGQAGVAQLIGLGRLRAGWRQEAAGRGPDAFMGTAAAAAGSGDADVAASSASGTATGSVSSSALDAAIAGLPAGGLTSRMMDAVSAVHGAPKSARARTACEALIMHGPAAMAAAVVAPQPRKSKVAERVQAVRPRHAFMRPKSTNAQAAVLKSSSAVASYLELDMGVYGRWMGAAARRARADQLRAALDAGHEYEDVDGLLLQQAAAAGAVQQQLSPRMPAQVPLHGPVIMSVAPSLHPHPSIPPSSSGGMSSGRPGVSVSHCSSPGPVCLTAGWPGAPADPGDPGHTLRGASGSSRGAGSAAAAGAGALGLVLPPEPTIPGRAPFVLGVHRPRYELADRELQVLPRPPALLQVLQPQQDSTAVAVAHDKPPEALPHGAAMGAGQVPTPPCGPHLPAAPAPVPSQSEPDAGLELQAAGASSGPADSQPQPHLSRPIVPPLHLPQPGAAATAQVRPHDTDKSLGHSTTLHPLLGLHEPLTPVHDTDCEGHSTCAPTPAITQPQTPTACLSSQASTDCLSSQAAVAVPPELLGQQGITQSPHTSHPDSHLQSQSNRGPSAERAAPQAAANEASAAAQADAAAAGGSRGSPAPPHVAPTEVAAVQDMLHSLLAAVPEAVGDGAESQTVAGVPVEQAAPARGEGDMAEVVGGTAEPTAVDGPAEDCPAAANRQVEDDGVVTAEADQQALMLARELEALAMDMEGAAEPPAAGDQPPVCTLVAAPGPDEGEVHLESAACLADMTEHSQLTGEERLADGTVPKSRAAAKVPPPAHAAQARANDSAAAYGAARVAFCLPSAASSSGTERDLPNTQKAAGFVAGGRAVHQSQLGATHQEHTDATSTTMPHGPPTLVWVPHAHPPVRPTSYLLTTNSSKHAASAQVRSPRGSNSRQLHGAGGALDAPPLLPQPAHMLQGATSSAIGLTHMLLPGIKAAVGGGGAAARGANDLLVRSSLPGPARSAMNALRGARPFSALPRSQPKAGAAATTTSAATAARAPRAAYVSSPAVHTGKAPPVIHTGTRPNITHDSIWDPLVHLDYPRISGRPGSLASGFHYSSADLTSYRWRPHEPQPSQAAFTTRSQLLAMAIEKDVAALLREHASAL